MNESEEKTHRKNGTVGPQRKSRLSHDSARSQNWSGWTRHTVRRRDGNTQTIDEPAMVVDFGVLVPAYGHSPQVLASILRTDQQVCNFDFEIAKVRLLKELVYAGHDFADIAVALSRLFISWGDCDLENRDHNGTLVEVNCERVKKGAIGRSWDVEFIIFKRYTAELALGEVDLRNNPGAGA